jgi:hypothetical protein
MFTNLLFLISSFRRVLYVLCFVLGNCPAFGVYMPTFRNTLFHLHRQGDVKFYSHLLAYENGTDRVFRNVGIKTSDSGELPKRKHTNLLFLAMFVTKID